MTITFLVIILGFIFNIQSTTANDQELDITFIGNCGFKIFLSDSSYLYTDFPYHSGAYNYMVYNFDSAYNQEDGIALFTHTHKDHFNKKSLRSTNLVGIYPKFFTGLNSMEIEKVEEKFDIKIIPFKTKHRWSLSHYSYMVIIDGMKLFFTGDTEHAYDMPDILQEETIDILFITPWLFNSYENNNLEIHPKNVFIYHHRKNPVEQYPKQIKSPCNCNLFVPTQGEKHKILK